jgi:hypothetical protein
MNPVDAINKAGRSLFGRWYHRYENGLLYVEMDLSTYVQHIIDKGIIESLDDDIGVEYAFGMQGFAHFSTLDGEAIPYPWFKDLADLPAEFLVVAQDEGLAELFGGEKIGNPDEYGLHTVSIYRFRNDL